MTDTLFTYNMTLKEIKDLLSFFRKQEQIPAALESFVAKLENDIYSSMTIDEAERFFV